MSRHCSSHCCSTERYFDDEYAASDLDDYRTCGPEKETCWLRDALFASVREHGLQLSSMSMLDIGGGVGPLHHELLKAGLARALDVDASHAFIAGSRQESQRQGHAERIEHVFGDFVALAPEIAAADIVSLDRVVCCYPDARTLVPLAASKAIRFVGLVYPVDRWWIRLGAAVMNVWERLKNGLPFWIHSTSAVDTMLRANGFERAFLRRSLLWQAMVYRRVSPAVA